MITVKEATDIVLNNTKSFGKETIPIAQALGRVLAEPLIADRDFPPFHRVTMDGIAIAYEQFAKGQRQFNIEGMQAAGMPQQVLENNQNCFEVMTGAVLPQNCDTVIRYEDLEIQNGSAKIIIEGIKTRQNVHRQGTDRKAKDQIVLPNKLISPAELGVAATVGKATLQVAKLPKVAIIYTGDELVEVDQKPLPHQIRVSNAYTIQSTLSKWHIQAERHHIIDDKKQTIEKINQCLATYDVLILSGGVSKGKFDYVPEALANAGVDKLFHKIKQRPGKPFWFGRAINGTTVFALPGNPVSAFMCLHRYFIPWLRKSLHLEPFEKIQAELAEAIQFKPDLTYLAQVKILYSKEAKLLALPIEGKGSGDLANLVDADAFIELPQGKTLYEKGEVYSLIPYRI